MRELLVVIDYQNDFVTGALGNPAAAALEPGIAARVAAQLERGGRVLFTRDTHGTDYLNTREGRFLPVAHCIKGSQGWGLYGSLSQYETGVRDGVSIVDKPTFGCAALPAEAEALCGGAPDSIEICGVVTDICVVSNAVLLHSAFLNARVAVLKDLCAAATPEGQRTGRDEENRKARTLRCVRAFVLCKTAQEYFFTTAAISSQRASMSRTSLNWVRQRSRFCPSRWILK